MKFAQKRSIFGTFSPQDAVLLVALAAHYQRGECENPFLVGVERLGPTDASQVIPPSASAVSNEGGSSPLLVPAPPFLGPGLRLATCWNRLCETVKTRKK